jgi:hypothetical protein
MTIVGGCASARLAAVSRARLGTSPCAMNRPEHHAEDGPDQQGDPGKQRGELGHGHPGPAALLDEPDQHAGDGEEDERPAMGRRMPSHSLRPIQKAPTYTGIVTRTARTLPGRSCLGLRELPSLSEHQEDRPRDRERDPPQRARVHVGDERVVTGIHQVRPVQDPDDHSDDEDQQRRAEEKPRLRPERVPPSARSEAMPYPLPRDDLRALPDRRSRASLAQNEPLSSRGDFRRRA